MPSKIDDQLYPFKGHKSFVDMELSDIHDSIMYTESQSTQLHPHLQTHSLNKFLVNDSLLGFSTCSYAEACDLSSFIRNVRDLREKDDDEFIPNPEGGGLEKDHVLTSQLSDRLGHKWSFEMDPQHPSAFDTNGTSTSANVTKSQNKCQQNGHSSRGLEWKTTDGGSSSPCTVSLSCQSEQGINHNHSVTFNSVFSTVSDFPAQREYSTPPFDSFLNVQDIEGALQRFEEDNKKNLQFKEKEQKTHIILSSPISSTRSYKNNQEPAYVETHNFPNHLDNMESSNILSQNTFPNKTLAPHTEAYSAKSNNLYKKSSQDANVPVATTSVFTSPTCPQPGFSQQLINSYGSNKAGQLNEELHYSNSAQFAVSAVAHRNAQVAANSLCQMRRQELMLALMITKEAFSNADSLLKQSLKQLSHQSPDAQSTKTFNNDLHETHVSDSQLTNTLSNLIELVVSSINVLIPGYLDAVADEGYNVSVERSPIILAHPDEFKNPSSFLKVYGDPHCSILNQNEKNDLSDHPRKGKDGNWECSQCHNINYPRRFRCNNQACRSLRDVYGDKVVSEYTRHVFYTYLVNISQKKKNIFERHGTNGIKYLITQTLPRKKTNKHYNGQPVNLNYPTLQPNPMNYKVNTLQQDSPTLSHHSKKHDSNCYVHSNRVMYRQKMEPCYQENTHTTTKLNKPFKAPKNKQPVWNASYTQVPIPYQSPNLYVNKTPNYSSAYHKKNRRNVF